MFFKRLQIKLKLGKSSNVLLSRTGGIVASFRIAKGLTLNSKHGLRISKSFGGLTFALQNGGLSYRGRWSTRSGYNLNLSKKGFSISKSFGIGSYNFTNPNRSSLTILGIQRRGKDIQETAAMIALGYILFDILKLFFLPIKFIMWFLFRYVIIWVLDQILELFIFFTKLILIITRFFLEIILSSIQFLCILIYSILGMCLNVIFFIFRQFKEDFLNKNITKFKFFYRYGWIPIFLSLILLKYNTI